LKTLERISNFIRRRSPATIIVSSVVVILAIGFADYFLGRNFSSALFFVVPVAVVTWYVGRAPGVVVSVLSGSSLVVTDWVFRSGEHQALAFWNVIFPFFFFIGFVILLTLLKDSLAREEELSRTDPLTGLSNRRYFNELVDVDIGRSRRYGHPVSFAYIDVDNFKGINDSLGHDKGDEVLCLIADQFRSFLRSSDLIARMGGDEFAILLPETGSEDAAVAMTKLQEDVNAASRGRGWPVTLSIGLVTYSVAPESLEEIIKEADAMMYAVKEKTKNNISFKTINYDADDSASRSVVRADGAR